MDPISRDRKKCIYSPTTTARYSTKVSNGENILDLSGFHAGFHCKGFREGTCTGWGRYEVGRGGSVQFLYKSSHDSWGEVYSFCINELLTNNTCNYCEKAT